MPPFNFNNPAANKIDYDKAKKQLEEIALRNISREINDSLQFCLISNLITAVASLEPKILDIIDEGFASSIKTLKQQDNPLGIGDIEKIKKAIDLNATIDQCAEPYLLILKTIRQIINDSKK